MPFSPPVPIFQTTGRQYGSAGSSQKVVDWLPQDDYNDHQTKNKLLEEPAHE